MNLSSVIEGRRESLPDIAQYKIFTLKSHLSATEIF